MESFQVTELLQKPPLVHGQGTVCWQISKQTAEYLDGKVQASWSTLEIGCGLSTIVFANRAQQHTCIVPSQDEVDRLVQFSLEQEISLDRVNFVVEKSQNALSRQTHGVGAEELDLVLIDGCHAFPSPFIDWYFAEPLLKVGGTLIVDDIQLWTGSVLKDFLKSDPAWKHECSLEGQSSVFRKLASGSTDRGWNEQPYVARRSRSLKLQNFLQNVARKLRG